MRLASGKRPTLKRMACSWQLDDHLNDGTGLGTPRSRGPHPAYEAALMLLQRVQKWSALKA